jgi:hypothetical protein
VNEQYFFVGGLADGAQCGKSVAPNHMGSRFVFVYRDATTEGPYGMRVALQRRNGSQMYILGESNVYCAADSGYWQQDQSAKLLRDIFG